MTAKPLVFDRIGELIASCLVGVLKEKLGRSPTETEAIAEVIELTELALHERARTDAIYAKHVHWTPAEAKLAKLHPIFASKEPIIPPNPIDSALAKHASLRRSPK